MSDEIYGSVWDAIEDTAQEAENMRLRSSLLIALSRRIETEGWTQMDAAARLGVTQPRVSDLIRGKIDLFSLDALVNMVSAAGLHVDMTVSAAA
ncbi:XRE family transcriptional regulator (plasmid) [Rhodococcus qingshengii]|uniref:helix-turn-helix domain-containing protein n=1 Tax=Rhodococcus TaxID=1827 RepID=UPI0007DB078E|nr:MULTISPECIES: XRE family transcriptional regulator [Rhodococcus]AZI66120.1 XRE family transcriptional regulator [Rhodococcus sp. NJ-530]BDQ24169.1 XRE family transcriptional regulator [Rhodococcus qingshengii]